MSSQFCTQCGKNLDSGARFCASCGTKTGTVSTTIKKDESIDITDKSPKSAVTALLLCLFLSPFGVHRFYVGKIGTGVLMLLTAGGLGIWALIDLVFIACCQFKDKEGRYLIFIREKRSPLKLALTVIGVLLAAIIVYALLLFMLVVYLTSSLTDTVQNQLAALQSGDIEKAYSYTSTDFQNATPLKNFKIFVNRFPALSNNKSVSFSERKINDNKGMLDATLNATDGTKTFVKYYFIKENNTWKILEIIIAPPGIEKTNGHAAVSVYQDENNRFSIQYPTNWEFEQRNSNSVAFGGKQGTASAYSTVSIQIVLSKKAGGIYKNIQAVVNDLKQQISKQTSDTKIEDLGDITLPLNSKIHGIAFNATYKYKGMTIKKMQFVLEQPDAQFFYSWGFTSPADRYNDDLPIAKAMFESWKIK